jgi:hypothetical protein
MTDPPEPRPCKRFAKRFVSNARLLAHLPDCDECRPTMLYLVDDSEALMQKRRAARRAARARPN